MKHSPALALAVLLATLGAPAQGRPAFFAGGSAAEYHGAATLPPQSPDMAAKKRFPAISPGSRPLLADASDSPPPRPTAPGPVASPTPGCVPPAPLEEITVKRINVIDETTGEVQLVIAGALPGPVVRGQQLERSIAPAGIVWHDGNGDESGGLVTAPVTVWKGMPRGTVRMMTFDYTQQITDAVRLGTYESDDGEVWEGGLTVYDRRPHEPGPVVSSQGRQRVFLGSHGGNAGLVVMDDQERERIRIGVDESGAAVIEMLDEKGQVVFRAPE